MQDNDLKRRMREPRILEAALEALRAYGIDAQIERLEPNLGTTRPDALIRLIHGGTEVIYAAEVKRWLTPTTLGNVAAQMRTRGDTTLLVTDYVTPQVAERLKQLNIAFADAAGNAYINRPPILVWVTGRKLEMLMRPPRAGRAFQPTGLKLIFALLCKPELVSEAYRDVARFAGVAHGTVGWVFTDLREHGYLLIPRRRIFHRKLRNRRALLAQWVDAYARTLRPQLLIGRYRAKDPNWWRGLDPIRYGALFGAEPAAEALTKYLKPGIVTLYMKGPPAPLIAEHQLVPAMDGNIELRRRFWPFDYEWPHPNLTPPILVYADLLATGDQRCLDTAERIYDAYLARFVGED